MADYKVLLVDTDGNPVSVAAVYAPTQGVDGSATITAGGTAQNLFSAATPANGFEIGNPDASEDLWVSDSTTAAANGTGSYRVAANGGTYTTPTGYKPVGAVSIVGATTGHKITARKW
jgi:hypothetical protein